jgi:hypothetical protein
MSSQEIKTDQSKTPIVGSEVTIPIPALALSKKYKLDTTINMQIEIKDLDYNPSIKQSQETYLKLLGQVSFEEELAGLMFVISDKNKKSNEKSLTKDYIETTTKLRENLSIYSKITDDELSYVIDYGKKYAVQLVDKYIKDSANILKAFEGPGENRQLLFITLEKYIKGSEGERSLLKDIFLARYKVPLGDKLKELIGNSSAKDKIELARIEAIFKGDRKEYIKHSILSHLADPTRDNITDLIRIYQTYNHDELVQAEKQLEKDNTLEIQALIKANSRGIIAKDTVDGSLDRLIGMTAGEEVLKYFRTRRTGNLIKETAGELLIYLRSPYASEMNAMAIFANEKYVLFKDIIQQEYLSIRGSDLTSDLAKILPSDKKSYAKDITDGNKQDYYKTIVRHSLEAVEKSGRFEILFDTIDEYRNAGFNPFNKALKMGGDITAKIDNIGKKYPKDKDLFENMLNGYKDPGGIIRSVLEHPDSPNVASLHKLLSSLNKEEFKTALDYQGGGQYIVMIPNARPFYSGPKKSNRELILERCGTVEAFRLLAISGEEDRAYEGGRTRIRSGLNARFLLGYSHIAQAEREDAARLEKYKKYDSGFSYEDQNRATFLANRSLADLDQLSQLSTARIMSVVRPATLAATTVFLPETTPFVRTLMIGMGTTAALEGTNMLLAGGAYQLPPMQQVALSLAGSTVGAVSRIAAIKVGGAISSKVAIPVLSREMQYVANNFVTPTAIGALTGGVSNIIYKSGDKTSSSLSDFINGATTGAVTVLVVSSVRGIKSGIGTLKLKTPPAPEPAPTLPPTPTPLPPSPVAAPKPDGNGGGGPNGNPKLGKRDERIKKYRKSPTESQNTDSTRTNPSPPVSISPSSQPANNQQTLNVIWFKDPNAAKSEYRKWLISSDPGVRREVNEKLQRIFGKLEHEHFVNKPLPKTIRRLTHYQGIFEAKITTEGYANIRVYFGYDGKNKKIVVLNAGDKETQARGDMDKAQNLMVQYLRNQN